MKPSIFLSILLLTCISTFVCIWYYRTSSSEAYVLVDLTDKKVQQVDAAAILDKVLQDNRMYGSVEMHTGYITDLDYNSGESLVLPAVFPLLLTNTDRQEEVTHFSETFHKSLANLYAKGGGRPQSSIYMPLVRYANMLAQSKASHKHLFVYSDLLENIDTFSIYRTQDSFDIIRTPDAILDRLESQAVPSDLTGVSIYFLYIPKDRKDEQRHLQMAALLQKIFKKCHATVCIGTNLSNN